MLESCWPGLVQDSLQNGRGELLQRDPFVDGVGLGQRAGAADDGGQAAAARAYAALACLAS